MSYILNAPGGNQPWNEKTYRTWFEAKLRSKMANDPQDGPYTGMLTGPPNPAKSLRRRAHADCEPDTGNIGENSHIEDASNTVNPEEEFRPVYTINNIEYQLSISIRIGSTTGNGTPVLVTRDRATVSQHKKQGLELVRGFDDDVSIPSNLDPTQSDDDDSAPLKGCYVRSESTASQPNSGP